MPSKFSFSGWSTSRIAPSQAFAGVSRAPTVSGADTRPKDVAIRASTFNNPNVPAFLNQAINDLNSEQSLKRALQTEWQDRLFRMASSDDPNAYLWQEAVRAASVTPGAHVSFGSGIQNPVVGQAQAQEAQAAAKESQVRTRALQEPEELQNRLAELERERASLGQSMFGNYTGSRQQSLDNDITNTYLNLNRYGRAGARGGSGWTPSIF
jgi:hypothetical protein